MNSAGDVGWTPHGSRFPAAAARSALAPGID